MTTSINSASDASTRSNSTQSTGTNAYDKLDTGAFIQMLLAEMQNQDPLSPMDNAQIVQQISQIKAIQSNTQLMETLESVLLGQNVSTASGMIGKTIQGLTADGDQVSGVVERVTITDGIPTLYVGEEAVTLKNVSAIQAAGAE